MTLAPDVAQLLELMNAAPPMYEGTPAEARDAFRMLTVVMRGPDQVPGGVAVSDAVVAGRPARVYRPSADGETARPTVAFLHGGGYVIGDLDTHDAFCRRMAVVCDAVVVASDYRLAPEHPFPAAVEDCLAFVREVHADRESYGGSDRVAVAGDSAGGNLSAIAAQELRDLPLAAQLLIYPAVDFGTDYPSLRENGRGYGLDIPTMAWFVHQYVGERRHDGSIDTADPRVAPIKGDLTGVAPALVVTAGYDPLRDEGEAYAARLRETGVRAEQVRYPDQIHGFLCHDHVCATSKEAIEDLLGRFAEVLRAKPSRLESPPASHHR